MSFEKLQGKKYGRLRVMAYHGKEGGHEATWFCECDCGGTKVATSGSLKSGSVRSCGCLDKEPHNYRHGGRHTKLYNVWRTMKQRCYLKSSKSYSNYGARGITVCNEWQNFSYFQSWARVSGYSDGLSIDRIDNDGNYCPDNCRWVDRITQANNKRSNTYIESNGVVKTLAQWARHYSISYPLFVKKIYRGMSFDDIALKPPVCRT